MWETVEAELDCEEVFELECMYMSICIYTVCFPKRVQQVQNVATECLADEITYITSPPSAFSFHILEY